MNKKFIPVLLFICIILIASFLRLYLLGSVPAGLSNDEVNTGYDAYSLLKTGKDQWGETLPLIFRGFGNYPPPLYRYLTVPFIGLFGLTPFALRLPSALLGIGSVVFMFFLAKKLFSKEVGLLSAFLLAVSPWAIGMSRIALEPNLSLFLVIAGLFFYFYSSKKFLFPLIGIFLIALTMHTYAAYTLFAPMIVVFLLGYSFFTKQLSLKKTGIAILFFLFLFFSAKAGGATARFSQVGLFHNITSIGLINTLNDQRGACLSYMPSFICKIENNKIILFSNELVKNYLSHFSFEFLFISGTSTQQSILPERGLDYLLSAVLFLFGLLALFKETFPRKLVLLFLFTSIIPDALTASGNFTRAYIMLPFLVLTEAIGGYTLYELAQKGRFAFFKKITLGAFSVICIAGIAIFSITYFTYFRDYYSRFSQYGYESVMKYIQAEHAKYQKVYITTRGNDAKQYVYYLFYTKYDPTLYQKKRDVSYHEGSDGWVSIDRIQNIYFVPSIDSTAMKPGNLFISQPADFAKCPEIFTVKDRIGYTMFEAVSSDTFIPCIDNLNTK